ncbi:MAG: prohibitin family protein [Clostridiales bacterium]|nr:prohibitin family protein [Clostridiales bacterium]
MEYEVITKSKKKIAKIVTGVVVGLLVLFVLFNCFVTVPAGHTGVVMQFGAVSDTVLEEGLHIKVPFVTQVVNVDNRVLKTEVSSTSASKDLQTISSTISLNYRVDRRNSAELYKNVGTRFEDVIVNPAIQECVKAVAAQFTAEELITQRQQVGDQMKGLLEEKIAPFGLSIEVFNIINFDFSEEFNAAIEAKQTAQQNALKAEQDLQRIRVEAEQKIEQARAEAESYKLKNQEITKETLAMEWINKWNGELPKVSSDANALLDIGSLLERSASQNTGE